MGKCPGQSNYGVLKMPHLNDLGSSISLRAKLEPGARYKHTRSRLTYVFPSMTRNTNTENGQNLLCMRRRYMCTFTDILISAKEKFIFICNKTLRVT